MALLEPTLCVLDEKWPLTYMQVLGPTVVDTNFETTVDVMMKVAAIMSGQTLPEAVRPIVEAKAREEDRVVIRLTPEWTVYTPPVHLQAGDDESKMKHGLAERLPWR